MKWGGGDAQAHAVVLWINTNGGEARYEPPRELTNLSKLVNGRKYMPPRIAVRTINGWAYAEPGHYIVKGTATFDSDHPAGCMHGHDSSHVYYTHSDMALENAHWCSGPTDKLTDFFPCDPETFALRAADEVSS